MCGSQLVTLMYYKLSGALAMKRYKTSRNLPVAWAVLLSFAVKKQFWPSATLAVNTPFPPKRRSSPRSHSLIPCNSKLLLPWLIFLTWLAPLVIELQSLEHSKLYSLAPIVLGHCINPHYFSVLRGKNQPWIQSYVATQDYAVLLLD